MRGKLLHDIIDTIIGLQIRGKILPSGLSVSRIIDKIQALMCTMTRNKTVRVEAPSKQMKEYYRIFDLNISRELGFSVSASTYWNKCSSTFSLI